MSIASELSNLAANRDAIKAAIEAKGVADAGETLAEFPAAIESIPSGGGGAPDTEPYPWIGSGMAAWLHFDSSSKTLTQHFRPYITTSASMTLDWGDGTTQTVQGLGYGVQYPFSHTYDTTGDYVLKLSGYGVGANNLNGIQCPSMFGPAQYNEAFWTDSLVQFESDAVIAAASSNPAFCPIRCARNLKWAKFAKCTTFGNFYFWGCANLRQCILPVAETINGQPFDEQHCPLERIDLPFAETISTNNAFVAPERLAELSLGAIVSIPSGAFSRCKLLESLVLPSGCTTVSGDAFFECYSLTSLSIPTSMQSIGNRAFYHCYSLTSITINATTPPTLGGDGYSSVFSGIPAGATITVPAGTLATYQTATNWASLASFMVEA